MAYRKYGEASTMMRELLDSSVKLMDGKSPLQMNLGPLNVIKKPLLGKIKGNRDREAAAGS